MEHEKTAYISGPIFAVLFAGSAVPRDPCRIRRCWEYLFVNTACFSVQRRASSTARTFSPAQTGAAASFPKYLSAQAGQIASGNRREPLIYNDWPFVI